MDDDDEEEEEEEDDDDSCSFRIVRLLGIGEIAFKILLCAKLDVVEREGSEMLAFERFSLDIEGIVDFFLEQR